ncbi:MAG: T9SS type A sorting domain-containing protein [Bacteroidota bacterium]
MKKVFLLLAGSIVALSSNAQIAKHFQALHETRTAMPATQKSFVPKPLVFGKTTAATFYTQTFAGGLPTGWSVGTTVGGTWRWTTAGSSSAFTMGAMASTTASNGWMIYDSDSIGAVCGSCAPSGYMQTAMFDCSTHPTVRLNFENYFRKFNDSCSIWVSTSPTFATYTAFPVAINNGLATNSSTANPSVAHINISSVAGSQPAVYIRFVYYGYAAGSYSWMVDDMSLSELDPHDVGISGSFLFEPDVTAYDGSIFTTPLAFVDSVYPVTLLSNYGSSAETAVSVTATIYRGGTSVYTQTDAYPTLPVNALDTIIQFDPPYLPTATGNYTTAFSTTVPLDADATNNVDSVFFAVSDTTWMVNSGNFAGSFFLHRATGGTPISYMQGARFDVPTSSVGDTVSGFGVSFASTSVPTSSTARVSVQLYSIQQSSTGWTYVGTSIAKPITAGDISSAGTTLWSDFRIDQGASGGIAPFILLPGTSYAAVVQISGVNTNLLVQATEASNATGFSGYFGQSDTSQNDGGTSFSPSSIATGIASATPLVRMYTGKVALPNSVTNVSAGVIVGKAFPNPANNVINVPFTLSTTTAATVSLTNAIGQVVRTQVIDATAGQTAKATFATSDLAAGVYLYTVEAAGQRTTGRVSITH